MDSENKWVHSSNFWIDLLRDEILLAEINREQGRAIFLHLADLGIFELIDEELWMLKTNESVKTSSALKSFMEKRLAEVARTEQGFAIDYFLPGTSKSPKPVSELTEKESDSESRGKKEIFRTSEKNLPAKTSDPSTLQIVKKYGRQIQSFMDLEQDMVGRLIGKHTTKPDARRIFNFVLGKMKAKTEPRPWEQLSRRRHK